ncbi:MAG: SDR family oxidoreductase [Myxococcota bacterium]
MSHTRIALVTGANRGIGLETSRQLAAQGVTVLMGGRKKASIETAAATLRAEGHDVHPVVLDVTRAEDIEAVRAHVAATYGRLDILVNNAGIIADPGGFAPTTLTVTPAQLRESFEVNVIGPVAIVQAFMPLLKAAPAARIVNLSSILASMAEHSNPSSPWAGVAPLAYDASKTALNQFTVHLAAALRGTPIKVNSAHPGWVKTDMGSEAAPMEVVDGAKTSVALALLSDEGPSGRFIHLGEEVAW